MVRTPVKKQQPVIDPESEKEAEPSFKIRNVPTIIPLRDLIVIIGALFTLGSGYFSFESRITILQHDFESFEQNVIAEIKKKSAKHEEEYSKLLFDVETLKYEILRGKKQN